MKHRGLKILAISVAVIGLASFTVLRQSPTTDNAPAVATHAHSAVCGKQCPRCEGTGRITNQCNFCDNGYRECQLCYGNKEIRCTYCQGGGSFRCNRCAGRGYIGESECPDCNASGQIECNQCHGTGQIACTSCGAEGHVACMTCGGKGYTEWNCPECRGTGVVDD